ncbi:hypothetical protein QY884_06335 [Latilactobacillus sakei]
MLLRLLVRSTINRARDYVAYLMACIMAIVVYFCFTAIKTDPVLSKLKSAGERLIFGGTIQIAKHHYHFICGLFPSVCQSIFYEETAARNRNAKCDRCYASAD